MLCQALVSMMLHRRVFVLILEFFHFNIIGIFYAFFESMGKRYELEGKRFGRLFVLKYFETRDTCYWQCVCDCGKTKVFRSGDLVSGKSKSCGCFRTEALKARSTHGMSNTKLYMAWHMMKRRCYDKTTKAYKYYGARGIKCCKRWHKFENFYSDMGERPPGKSLERVDNDGNYCKKNCIWLKIELQPRNTRGNVLLTYKNETKCIAEWAEITGFVYETIRARIQDYGWAVEDALTIPVNKRRSRNLIK